jgi:hypothetical protein
VTTRAALIFLLGVVGCWAEEEQVGEDFFACTEMGCENRLSIVIEHRDREPFSPGVYTVEATPTGGDQLKSVCVLEEAGTLACRGDAGIVVDLSAGNGTFQVHLNGAPAGVTAALKLDESRLGEEAFTPDYTIVTPNGTDCEPICFQATVAMELAG